MQHLGSFSAAQRGFTSTVDELAAFGGTPAGNCSSGSGRGSVMGLGAVAHGWA